MFFALLSDALKIRIQSHDNRADMELFVRRHVTLAAQNRKLLNGNVSDDIREDLVQRLLDGAKEM